MSKAEFRFSPRPNRAAEIDWQGWGETAFARARRENKPVLLAISAVWCHWCHVMDETSYSDLDVIALINDRYLPIRVDADRQPEVNARYNMGGWPTTAVLTPDGDTITGATYIAPAQMREFLRDISEFFHSQRSLLDAKLAETRARSANLPTERGTLTVAIIDSVISTIGEAYDEEYGGFGGEPKFPQTDLLEFLLRELRLRRATGNDDGGLYEMLAKTALAMGRSGMYDHIEGGFFRYSTTRDWTIPHFEKMTEDHGGLLRVYAGLYRISHNGAFRETLHSATRYVRTVLRDARTGLFAGSQDADESYFTSSLEDRMTRDAPDVDRTSYVNWTANVCCGLLAAADALGDDDLGAYAVTAIDAMVDAAMLDADGLVRHYIATDGSAHGRGLLDDQAWLLRAFVEAHAYDGEPRHRERALALADAILAAFVAADGGIVDNAYGAAGLGRVSIPSRPIREIAHLADTLLVLAALADNARYADAAHGALEMFVPVYRRSGTFAAPFAAAARRALAPPTIVTLVGAPADTIAFRADARMLPDPFTVVRTFAPDDPRLATAGLPPHAPRAYVCVGTTCGAPVDDPAAIRDAYLRLIDSVRSITLELDTKASQSESS